MTRLDLSMKPKDEEARSSVDAPLVAEEIPSIDEAPRRVQRDYYRRERIIELIAIAVVMGVVALVAWGGYRLVIWIARPN